MILIVTMIQVTLKLESIFVQVTDLHSYLSVFRGRLFALTPQGSQVQLNTGNKICREEQNKMDMSRLGQDRVR